MTYPVMPKFTEKILIGVQVMIGKEIPVVMNKYPFKALPKTIA